MKFEIVKLKQYEYCYEHFDIGNTLFVKINGGELALRIQVDNDIIFYCKKCAYKKMMELREYIDEHTGYGYGPEQLILL